MRGSWGIKRNTNYHKLLIMLNEGGHWVTFTLAVFKPEYNVMMQHKGLIRLWIFGKEFKYWIPKNGR